MVHYNTIGYTLLHMQRAFSVSRYPSIRIIVVCTDGTENITVLAEELCQYVRDQRTTFADRFE